MPKFCHKCGNPLNENDKFCRKCGNPVGVKARVSPQEDTGEATVIEIAQAPITEMSGVPRGQEQAIKKGTLMLGLQEMLRGCTKIVDFGTGKRYEIIVPGGLTPGDVLKISNTGIVDPDSGNECEIELTTSIE